MIILDTNVLSELMREKADARVIDWVSAQASANLFTTVVSEAEVFFGLAALPAGKRRKALEEAAAGLFADFDGRVLVFDSSAARLCHASVERSARHDGEPRARSRSRTRRSRRSHAPATRSWPPATRAGSRDAVLISSIPGDRGAGSRLSARGGSAAAPWPSPCRP